MPNKNSNSSSNEDCPLLDWYKLAGGQIGFGVYYVFTPFYFILGVLAHVLSLKAFLKRANKEKAFIYQIMESASKLCAIVFRSIYVVAFVWLTGRHEVGGFGGQWWFVCNACLWFTAIVPLPTMNVFFTTTELLSIFVIYNRVLAIVKPFQYKNANHKRNQIIVAVFCVVIGFATSAYHYPNYRVVKSGALYKISADNAYQNTMTFVVLNQLRNVVRGISLIALYVGNFALVWLFRKHQKQKPQLRSRYADAKDKEEAETTLTVICLCQSLFVTISGTAIIGYYGVNAMSRSFGSCESNLLTPVLDGAVALADICDFYLACLINRSFRKMVFGGMAIFNSFGSTVTPHITFSVADNRISLH